MMALQKLWTVALAGALLSPLAASLAGCGNGTDAKVATVKAGDMPSGAKWDGVYFSELYGFLHIKKSGGNHIKGRWERPHKDKWGEVDGDVEGDLFKFSWSEYTRGLVGPNAKRTGKGYFKYKRPAGATDEKNDTVTGEIGSGEDEVGSPWEAIKQFNIPADPDSIVGSGASDVGGGDWDSDSKEKGKPEGPSSPR
jgi:hypothetical protein